MTHKGIQNRLNIALKRKKEKTFLFWIFVDYGQSCTYIRMKQQFRRVSTYKLHYNNHIYYWHI